MVSKRIIIDEAKCGMYCDAEDYMGLSKLLIDFKTKDIKEFSNKSYQYYKDNFSKDLFFQKIISEMENNLWVYLKIKYY